MPAVWVAVQGTFVLGNNEHLILICLRSVFKVGENGISYMLKFVKSQQSTLLQSTLQQPFYLYEEK